MRARDLLGLLGAWHRRSPQPSLQNEAYGAALDRLVGMAFDSGVREEQARIAAIIRLPQAAGFPRLSLSLALSGVFSAEQATQALADAEFDVLARLHPTTESPMSANTARVLH
jgi:hypothetical protein